MRYVFKPSLENLLLYGAFIFGLNLFVFGFAAPFMISEDDTLLVTGGFAVSLLMLYLDIKLVRHVVNFSKESVNEEN
jgi:hypothetical protein